VEKKFCLSLCKSEFRASALQMRTSGGQHSNGMPYGMQLMGKSFKEAEMLAFVNSIMK